MSITIENLAQLQNAVAKAKKVRPHVKFVSFGQYEVAGSKGQIYTVKFGKRDGQRVAVCGCQANKERGLACYHVAAAGGHHALMLKQRQEAAQAAPTGDDLAAHVAGCDDPDCGHSPVNGPIISEEPWQPVGPQTPVTDAPMIFACSRPAMLSERTARDRANIAAIRTRLTLPGPVIPTFASREEARRVAEAANDDLFGSATPLRQARRPLAVVCEEM